MINRFSKADNMMEKIQEFPAIGKFGEGGAYKGCPGVWPWLFRRSNPRRNGRRFK
jgi:hypothetical protein